MNLFEWIASSLSTTLLVAVLGWLTRNLILARLKATVQHEFDTKLESLRTDLRKNEESFRADLRARETDIEVLRKGALSGMTGRQALIDQRRIEAADFLWAGMEQLIPFKYAVTLMAAIDFEKTFEAASNDQKVRDGFGKLAGNIDPMKLTQINVYKARPFVSDLAWALFSSYQAIVMQAAIQLYMLKIGLNKPGIWSGEHVQNLAKLALPQLTDYINKEGKKVYPNLLEPLETELLGELRQILRGEESDRASIEQAAKIMAVVASVNEDLSKTKIEKSQL